MASAVMISFKDMDPIERVREALDGRCRALGAEFPEVTRIEVTISPDGVGHLAHGHVTGSHTEVAGHAQAGEPGQAADKLLDTLERQLRKLHDKKIFARRREAQKNARRRRSGD